MVLDNFIVSASDYLAWRLVFFCNIYVGENLKLIQKFYIHVTKFDITYFLDKIRFHLQFLSIEFAHAL